MKDELELLKKDWKNRETDLPKMSYNDIYGMIHKKSSSIVKWILVICIVELLFWSFLNFLIPESALKIYEEFDMTTLLFVTQILHYGVVLYFIYLFYKNYKSISVIESTNMLMNKIIYTRKTVNYYVYYNIALYIVLTVVVNLIMFSDADTLLKVMNPTNLDVEKGTFINILLIVQIVAVIIVVGLLLLYYKLIYGILLKKLNKNYKELETLKL